MNLYSWQYSGTLDYEHNPFQENACNPNHSYIKAGFPIGNNGNSVNSFHSNCLSMSFCMWPQFLGVPGGCNTECGHLEIAPGSFGNAREPSVMLGSSDSRVLPKLLAAAKGSTAPKF